MAAGTVADYASTILKTIYSGEAIENSVLGKSAALGMIPKDESFTGYDFKEVLFYGDLGGVGNVFSSVQSSTANPADAIFQLTRKETYAVAQLEGWLIEAAKGGDRAAFISALKRHMDSALHAISLTMSHQIYRNKYGSRGNISNLDADTTVATGTYKGITLSNPDDIVMFEKGMPLVASVADGGVLRTVTAVKVATVDRDTGSFTTDVNCGSGGALGWTAGDYLYRTTDTDATAGAVSSGLCISGLRDWLPASVTSALFFGQNRALDACRLSGLRYDGSAKSHREAFNNAVARADRDDCMFDHVFMPTANYAKFVNELGTNVRYCQGMANGSKGPSATIGFEGIQIVGPGGKPVKIFPDRWCPAGIAFCLKLDTWKIRSLNKAPHVLDLDGLTMLRQASANAYEIRWGASWQLGCRNPGANMVITLPA